MDSYTKGNAYTGTYLHGLLLQSPSIIHLIHNNVHQTYVDISLSSTLRHVSVRPRTDII